MHQPYEHHSATRKTFRKATRIKQNLSGGGNHSTIVSAAIHIGSSFSCHCFSMCHDTETPYLSTWKSEQGRMESKTKTALLFDEKKRFQSYGDDAFREYSELLKQGKDKEWYFFPKFKLKLDNKEVVTGDIFVEDINRRQLPAILLMTEAIRYMKNHLIETKLGDILREFYGDPGIPIQWVVAVPTAWNETSKQFMTHASLLAGIPVSQLLVVKESDAAIQFCGYNTDETFRDEFLTTVKGNNFMLLDAGGHTVNITTHTVAVDGSLSEITNRRMDALGGGCVDEKFLQMLIKIFGNPVLQRFREEDPYGYFDLQNSIELKKKCFNPSSVNKVIVPVSDGSLNEICIEELNESIKQALESSTFKEDITIHNDKLRINHNTYKTLFQETIDAVIQYIREEVQLPDGQRLKAVVMVGGFSECILLQENIKKSFPEMKVMIPPQAMFAALIGSTRVGHIVTNVKARKSNFTIGVATLNDFDTEEHPQGKQIEIGEKKYCKNVFSYHINKDTILEEGFIHSTKLYSTLDTKTVLFKVYASFNDFPVFVDGVDCQFMKSLSIDVPATGEYEGNVLLKMYQGNSVSYLEVEAIETYSGISEQISINLDGMSSPIELYKDWNLSL